MSEYTAVAVGVVATCVGEVDVAGGAEGVDGQVKVGRRGLRRVAGADMAVAYGS